MKSIIFKALPYLALALSVFIVLTNCVTKTPNSVGVTSFKPLEVENLKQGINHISFMSQGDTLAGDLYLPADFNSKTEYPTIIYSGPMTQVKEQTGAVYGAKLSAKGYVTLTFDHVNFGESEGLIRNYENPYLKMENIRDGISFLRTLKFVDKDKLYGLGVCASGSYMTMVAMTDKRLNAVASVSAVMNTTASRYHKDFFTREQIVEATKVANEARQKYYETGEIEYYDFLNLESIDPNAISDHNSIQWGIQNFYMTERAGAETYPRYSHLVPKFTAEIFPQANAILYAPVLYTPYLGIYGENADWQGPDTTQFYEAASEPKELFEVKGASHVGLYDTDMYVDQAVDRMDDFFGKY